MNVVLAFIPVSRQQAAALTAGESLQTVQAFLVNQALLATLELGPTDSEEAERGAMLLASVHGLARHGERIVLVAQVSPASVQEGDETHNGGVRLQGLVPAQVQSFFTDEPAQQLLAAAAAASHGLCLDDAWELDEVQSVLRGCDLLWHGAEELALFQD